MGAMRTAWRWLVAKARRVREWSSGDDLHEAQMNRSDYHEFKSNPGGPGA